MPRPKTLRTGRCDNSLLHAGCYPDKLEKTQGLGCNLPQFLLRNGDCLCLQRSRRSGPELAFFRKRPTTLSLRDFKITEFREETMQLFARILSQNVNGKLTRIAIGVV